jgi:hypothetical protein
MPVSIVKASLGILTWLMILASGLPQNRYRAITPSPLRSNNGLIAFCQVVSVFDAISHRSQLAFAYLGSIWVLPSGSIPMDIILKKDHPFRRAGMFCQPLRALILDE